MKKTCTESLSDESFTLEFRVCSRDRNSCPVHCPQEFQPIEYPGSQAREIIDLIVGTEFPPFRFRTFESRSDDSSLQARFDFGKI